MIRKTRRYAVQLHNPSAKPSTTTVNVTAASAKQAMARAEANVNRASFARGMWQAARVWPR